MLLVVNSQTQILETDEDCAEQVASAVEFVSQSTTKHAVGVFAYMNSTRNPLCWCEYRTVSKMDRRIRPTVPRIANIIDNIARALSSQFLLWTSRPLCLSQRSETKAQLKKTPVMTHPVIKKGFRPSAPTSEMYLCA